MVIVIVMIIIFIISCYAGDMGLAIYAAIPLFGGVIWGIIGHCLNKKFDKDMEYWEIHDPEKFERAKRLLEQEERRKRRR